MPERILPERHGLAWDEAEERKLYDAYVAEVPAADCASAHGRTTGGIRSHLREMGLLDEEYNPILPIPPYAPTPAVAKRALKAKEKTEKLIRIQARQKQEAEKEPELTPELNDRFRDALRIMADSDESVFITGKAGTGKSTLLRHFCRNTKKNVVVLAPTGVAALNVKGQTIHNFFRFQIDVTPQKIEQKRKPRNEKIYKSLQTIVIDEVSMVRADVLDCVATFLRMHGPRPGRPFGGVQMIFIGDLFQLPPVVTTPEREIFSGHYATPYFFSAHCMQGFPLKMIELEKVYRQKDQRFVDVLNRVRNNSVNESDLEILNSRFGATCADSKAFSINLTTTNRRADEINHNHLTALKGKIYTSAAQVDGNFGREYYPTAPELTFKVGAQIMLLNNDKEGQWVNGSLGVIESVAEDEAEEQYLKVRLHDEMQTVDVYRHKWEVYKFALAENQIMSEPIGTFAQYPFRLAWAVTIHKSQGKTFERVTIDIGEGTFAGGQMYVALSRCTALEGIVLKTPIRPQHIRTDPRIGDFLAGRGGGNSEPALPKPDKSAIIRRAIEGGVALDIVYLKGNDEKTARTVRPLSIGEEVFKGRTFLGMKALCLPRGEELMFSVERILEIRKAGE